MVFSLAQSGSAESGSAESGSSGPGPGSRARPWGHGPRRDGTGASPPPRHRPAEHLAAVRRGARRSRRRPAAHRVRPVRRGQPGCRPGRDAPRRARAGHRARRRDRDVGGCAQRRGRRLLAEPHRSRATRPRVDVADVGRRVPRLPPEPGVERGAPRDLPLRSDRPRRAGRPGHAGPELRGPRGAAPRHRDRSRLRRRSRVRAGSAETRAARERGAPGRVPDRRARRPALGGRRRRRQRPAVARALRSGRPGVRVQRVGGRGRSRGAIGARRGDDEFHALAQPAVRARDAQRVAARAGDRAAAPS